MAEMEGNRKPQDTPFRQQQLRAWRPLLTPGNLFPHFCWFGIVCIAIGIGLYVASSSTTEKVIDYTKSCFNKSMNKNCHELMNGTTCECELSFNLTESLTSNVVMYYGLTNFFQNHRSYVKSRDDNQLLGKIFDEPSSTCDPLGKPDKTTKYIPCGAIANSLFSDTITLKYHNNGTLQDVGLIRTGIALDVDKKYKFKNPSLSGFNSLSEAFKNASYVRPKSWHLDIWDLDPDNQENNGLQNEDLMVWMRTAALPDFRKIYRRINHVGTFKDGLPSGQYTLKIAYRYDVVSFGGTKSIVLSNTSILGGKNNFFGVLYISFGCVSLLLAVLLYILEVKKRPGTSRS